MPYANTPWSRNQMELLVNVSTTLADLTATAELCTRIPAFLSRSLDLEPITLAVIRATAGDPEITFIQSSGQVATGEGAPTFNQNILELYRQTKPLGPSEAPMLRHAFNVGQSDGGFSEVAVQNLVTFPRALVFSRTIDEQHRLVLVVHHHPERSVPPTTTEILVLVATQLSKLLKCIVNWQDQPGILGEPFERLTDREWTVLRALNSDAGEKQLADQLNLSPHTLHSHIKAIYRKVGVQGRLPLLLRLQEALRDLRNAAVNARGVSSTNARALEPRAVAVG